VLPCTFLSTWLHSIFTVVKCLDACMHITRNDWRMDIACIHAYLDSTKAIPVDVTTTLEVLVRVHLTLRARWDSLPC